MCKEIKLSSLSEEAFCIVRQDIGSGKLSKHKLDVLHIPVTLTLRRCKQEDQEFKGTV